jgi:hemoglobin/transferrin/lactoferrin receptor protein
VSGVQRTTQTRYPEGGSETWSASAYASYKWIISEKSVLNAGARYSRAALSSDFTAGILPYEHIEINNGAFTGSLGFIYTPSDNWQINTILSSGFRNPNVDDFGKVRAKDDYITVPNASLSPEYSYNAEIGFSRIVEGYMKIEVVGFYTYLRDAIVRTSYQINGEDSLLYDGDMYKVTANYNAARGIIYGGSFRFTSNLNKNITLNGTLNYTHGHNITDDVPLGHIPPVFGRTNITYRRDRFFFNMYAIYQGWKQIEDFSPYGEDNEGEAMQYGFPSWWTLNMKSGFNLGQHFEIMLAVENLFDEFYKPYAAGISAAGRNFILTARYSM